MTTAGTSGRYRGRGEPKNLNAIEARLRQLALDVGEDGRRLRHRLSVIVLADALNGLIRPEANERFLIKGGTALMLRYGLAGSRFSRDLDAMMRGQVDQLVERLRERGRSPHHGWTFVISKVEAIDVPGMSVTPRRATVKLAYNGKPYSTVQLEIAPEEGAAAAEHDTTTATDLADLGFLTDTPTQQLMTVRYQVAQKLHACTTPRNDGKPNNRAHDLVDLALLEEAVREALPEVREACIEIFFVRDSTPWPPTLRPETGWDILYLRAAEGLEGIVPSTLDDAVDSVTALITAIDSANSA